jgi:hypothetical protein
VPTTIFPVTDHKAQPTTSGCPLAIVPLLALHQTIMSTKMKLEMLRMLLLCLALLLVSNVMMLDKDVFWSTSPSCHDPEFLMTAPLISLVNTASLPRQPTVQPTNQHSRSLRRLEFLHIPKTGGTAMETLAAQHNLTWGMCHFVSPELSLVMSNNETHCPANYNGWKAWRGSIDLQYHECPWWHTPAQYFEQDKIPINPYADADLFAVVRNPYDRILSHYYYIHGIKKSTVEEANSVAELNSLLNHRLTHVMDGRREGYMGQNVSGNRPYFMFAGHFIPQYDYVFDYRRRMVEHVIKFENLTAEFDELMKEYNLSFLKLPQKRFKQSVSKQLGVYNISKPNLQMIEQLFARDFYEFGYDMISDIISDQIYDHTNQAIIQDLKQKETQRMTKTGK